MSFSSLSGPECLGRGAQADVRSVGGGGENRTGTGLEGGSRDCSEPSVYHIAWVVYMYVVVSELAGERA